MYEISFPILDNLRKSPVDIRNQLESDYNHELSYTYFETSVFNSNSIMKPQFSAPQISSRYVTQRLHVYCVPQLIIWLILCQEVGAYWMADEAYSIPP